MRTQSITNVLGRRIIMKLNQPCIAIDVSKGISHVCVYSKVREPFSKVFKIKHDRSGLGVLEETYEAVASESEKEPIFIYEATGIYHRPLRNYIETKGYDFIEVSPLLAAKHRKNSSIRSAKTDTRDTHALARLFYEVTFDLNNITDDVYYELQQLSRFYSSLEPQLIKSKVHFNEKLDVLFPNFRKEIDDCVYRKYYLEILKACPHPSLLANRRIDWIENMLIRNGIQPSRAQLKAQQIKAYCHNCWPGSQEDSIDSIILKTYIDQIQYYTKTRENTLSQMINMCEAIPLYHQLLSIPGISYNLACRLVAELGNLSHFLNHKQLLAYAGLDPIINQSGLLDGKGLSISKKGNKHLRKLLYLAISTSAHTKYDHRIKSHFQKKRQKSSPKSAYIASCDKLLRIIFKINQTGELYIF